MRNLIWISGLAIGLASLILKGIELYYSITIIPSELYIGVIFVLLIGSIIWVLKRNTSSSSDEPQKKPFKRNERVMRSLEISDQELKVLEQLTKGRSNQEIADTLKLSPNKVKTTLTGVYKKLNVDRRSKAAIKAKALKLVP